MICSAVITRSRLRLSGSHRMNTLGTIANVMVVSLLGIFRAGGIAGIACETTKKDRYKRWLARCNVGGVDLALWLAGHGWAVPYRDCKCEIVRDAADMARLERVGIWSGTLRISVEVAEASLRQVHPLMP
jgi:hypothetical protein